MQQSPGDIWSLKLAEESDCDYCLKLTLLLIYSYADRVIDMSNKIIIFLLFVLMALPNAFAAQTNRGQAGTKKADQKPKTAEKSGRHVTVNLKNGDVLSGDFIQASAESVEIEVNGVRQKISLDEVATMVFASGQRISSAPSRDTVLAAEAAVKSLRKLAATTMVKPAFQDYQSRLIDVKVDVEDALARLPEGNLKTEMKLALEAFVDAENIWYEEGDIEVILPAKDELAAQLMKKYEIPPIEPNTDPAKLRLDRDIMLNKIWASARAHMDKLAPLLNSFASSQ